MSEALQVASPLPVARERPRDASTDVSNEQLRLGYANLPISQAVALLNGCLLALVLSGETDRTALAIWLAALLAVALVRLTMAARFRRATLTASQIPAWRARFLGGAFASGVVWGGSALLLYPHHSIVHQVFVAFVVGGMVLGAVVSLTSMLSAFVLFAACAVVPLVLRYLAAGDAIHYAMAALSAIFLVAMCMLGKRIHDTLSESLTLRFENRDLIAYLSNNRSELVAANADLLATQEQLTRVNEALEVRVAERTEALQAANRRKDEFLAVLSHELRNPLAPIQNSVYMLNRLDPASEQARQARGIIERQTRHITRLVDDLLDVTRIARGKIELRREATDLTELVARTAQDYAPVFQQYGIVLSTRLAAQPIRTCIDATRIAQLVGNLLQNAARFTPAGGEVKLSLELDATVARIRVADTGAGIPPDLMPSLFEPFMQGKQTLARTEGGLGLGLALVKGIVELHGGRVHAASDGVGKGSTFTVELPLAAVEATLDAMKSDGRSPAASRRVLVVDDNKDAAESLAQLVRMFGHHAEVAYDGRSALAEARRDPPDVILCDLGLPDLTGYEIARLLHADHPEIRLLAVSGYAQPEDIAQAIEAGFERHMAKPLDPENLRRVLA